jgi:methyl acetate hydrolase
LRSPASAPTVRQLLTHTSGFGYEMWSEDLVRCQAGADLPSIFDDGPGFLNAPLLFDPGTRWMYGISTDWLGRLVEHVSGTTLDAYFETEIFEPLGLRDTCFIPHESAMDRLAAVQMRGSDRTLTQRPMPLLASDGFLSGGGGLVSTAGDYLTFLRALLGGGALGETRILSPESVGAMSTNQIGALEVERLVSTDAATSADVDFYPGIPKHWGLGFLINAAPVPGGRSAGSYGWAGLFNSYYWVDPASGLCALLLTQVLPFFDRDVVALLERFETAVYAD